MTVLLGFDFGQKRTGVAIAQDGTTSPLMTLDSSNMEPDILELVAKYHPSKLVVGIPRSLDGEDTAQTKLARTYGEKLSSLTGLPIAYQDEALSSERALERLGTKSTIADRKKVLDQIAAQIILEDYLNESK